jgi:ABC-type phosphate transport system substrate-binding protein
LPQGLGMAPAWVVLVLAVLPLVPTSLPAAPAAGFVIVVNRGNPVVSLSVAELQRMYRKQTRMWPHGEPVVPVDSDATSDIRQEFSETVLNRSVREMGEFWVQQSITQGLTPPTSLKSPRAILRFIASVPGAIGYVPAVDMDDTVKRVDVKGLQ